MYEAIGQWLKQAAQHAEALTEMLVKNLRRCQVEIDAFGSFVKKGPFSEIGWMWWVGWVCAGDVRAGASRPGSWWSGCSPLWNWKLEERRAIACVGHHRHGDHRHGADPGGPAAQLALTEDRAVPLCMLERIRLRAYRALQELASPLPNSGRYRRRDPTMAIGWTDLIWSREELICDLSK